MEDIEFGLSGGYQKIRREEFWIGSYKSVKTLK